MVVFLVTLGLAAGCVSEGQGPEAVSAKAPLDRQLGRADDAFNARAYGQALDMYSALYLAALSGDYKNLAAEAAAQASTINALEGATEESDRWMSFAERYAEGEGDGPASRVMLARGIRQWKRGDSIAARETFDGLVQLCERADLTVRAMQGASLVALVTEGDEQLDWSLKSIEVCQRLEEPRWEGALWSNHGWLLEARGEYADASRCFERARLLLAESSASPMDLLQVNWAFGRSLRLEGRLQEARVLLELAEAQGRELYAANPSARQAEWLGRAWWELGEVDAREGREDSALRLFEGARRKLLEAGAADAAPALLGRLDARLIELSGR